MSGFTRHIETSEPIRSVKERLLGSISRRGFVIAGVSDLHEVFSARPTIPFKSYVCYEIYVPWVYREILLASSDVELIPCTVTIREHHDSVSVSIINTTAMMLTGLNNKNVRQALGSLDNLLDELSKELSKPVNFIPDLDTSAE